MAGATILRNLGLQDYREIWGKMQQFTAQRDADTSDEIWITQHPAVYTFGLNAKREHLLNTSVIPLVDSDRGGQITYHGPGQLIVYVLFDLKRLSLGPRQMVNILEDSVIDSLRQYGIKAQTLAHAPGVYVGDKKIASLGLRIKRGCCYHGLSLNNNMDLTPFENINPCGYSGLQMTQMATLGVDIKTEELAVPIIHHIIKAIES